MRHIIITDMDLVEELANLGIRTGVVSNADSRIRESKPSTEIGNTVCNFDDFCLGSVLADLDILSRLDFCILSEEVGFEKPSQEIWEVALKEANMTGRPEDVLHVGDELEACVSREIDKTRVLIELIVPNFDRDYFGAKNAGLEALLLKRTDDPEAVTAETDGNSTVEVINHLRELLQRIRR
jgi:FMN phosphatase YigB (HAD superfamily)